MNSEYLVGIERAFRLRQKGLLGLLCLIGLIGIGPFSLGGPDLAHAAPPIQWTKCDGADPVINCNIPRGVAANPENGRVVVADQVNRRILEFDARGDFLKAWGWDVVVGGGTGFEICIRKDGDVCKPGINGPGAGQLSAAMGTAIDSAGAIYVVDFTNRRVQKFDRDGNFVLMFGGEVNKTKVEEGGKTEAEENLCPVDPGDECKAGVQGSTGQGRFGEWAVGSFITITPADAVYVGDANRIQRFDTNGEYQGEIAVLGEKVQGLASDAAGNLYAIYDNKDDVRKITPAGEELESPRFKVEDPKAVAVDAAGHLYVFGPICSPCSGSPVLIDPILEFDPAANLLDQFGKGDFDASTGLAANLCSGSAPPGNVYASNASTPKAFVRAYGTEPIGCFRPRTLPADPIEETSATLNGTLNPKGGLVTECFFEWGLDEEYGQTAPCVPGSGEIGTGSAPVSVEAGLTGLAKGTSYHFRLVSEVDGEAEVGADEVFKTLGPPTIAGDHTVGATDTEATLKALVNPEGFATSCRVEYGTTTSYGQITGIHAVGKDGNRESHVVLFTLKGLTPGTTYHWRMVCVNSSDLTQGVDHVVNVYRTFAAEADCSNQEFRTSASSFLPDCRAYEMVSPVDKNGGNIEVRSSGGNIQIDSNGEKITYNTMSAFGDVQNSFVSNQYLATRHEPGGVEEGWANHSIHPPLEGRDLLDLPGPIGLLRDFMTFTPDLCSAWIYDYFAPTLTVEGVEGYPNIYRQDNCGTGAEDLEAVTVVPPPQPPGGEAYIESTSMQGVSDDGRHAVFVADAKLTEDAAVGTNAQVYDHYCPSAPVETCSTGESLNRLVSVLPNGNASTSANAVGGGWGQGLDNAGQNLANAVSADGSRIYWTAGIFETGRLFLRLNPEQQQSAVVAGKCTEPAKACTVPVSTTSEAFYWTAAVDGSKALYSEGSLFNGTAKLFEFDLESGKSQAIAEGVDGVVGASDDLSRIYLVSRKALPGSGQNSEGAEALDGEHNLYLREGNEFSFIATLDEGDTGARQPGFNSLAYDVASREPSLRTARVTPDGARLVFQSREPLTGFDNTDAANGKPDVQVFSYQASGELLCVSCNPSGGRPQSRELHAHLWAFDPLAPVAALNGVFAAAWIPGWENPLYANNVLSDDGTRIFFNANDALLPRDTNGTMDVYEWEAPGAGSCDTEDPSYFPQNGGCLYLISSGESPFESEFWEASKDGSDVFINTESSLLPQDPGLVDLYDARVEGGFPQPIKKEICEGEGCQSPPPPPTPISPASRTYSGPGNPAPGKGRCPKGKRKVRRNGKVRCVKKQAKRRKAAVRRAGAERRAGR